jgi:hypothetical protein
MVLYSLHDFLLKERADSFIIIKYRLMIVDRKPGDSVSKDPPMIHNAQPRMVRGAVQADLTE